MKKLLLVIMFLIPCSICSFLFKRKATFFIDKNTSKNTKIVYLQDRNLYLDINRIKTIYIKIIIEYINIV